MNKGEIYSLGNHRLMCGDATNRDDVMNLIGNEHIDLVLTDPPYGRNTQTGYYRYDKTLTSRSERMLKIYAQEHYKHIIGDKNTNAARKHYSIVKDIADNLIFWGANYFSDFLPPRKSWLVWAKHQTFPNHAQAELAYTTLNTNIKLYSQTWNGFMREGSLKLNPKPALHMSQKPVELHMRILEDFTREDSVILDCFGGSGTTLIACNETGRKCLMMEISPEYCDVIVSRWEKLTGKKGEKIA